jgi:glucose/arabinose dehydrogenase
MMRDPVYFLFGSACGRTSRTLQGLLRRPAFQRAARRTTRHTRLEHLEDRITPTTLPDGFSETVLAIGLSNPTAMAMAPDGRIFVDLQQGDVMIFKDGGVLPTPFLHLNVDSNGERGLLGVAFDPDFVDNQYVYVYYTVPGSPAHNRVSRFTANGDVADPNSEVVLLDLDNLSDATNHNGGAIHFGLDGKLYVGVGENANASNSQDPTNLLGKILRINADGSVPGDNPFLGVAGARPEIWALGFRNPFTFAVQPGTGRIFVNDVGSNPPNAREEINDLMPGGNYGWPVYEGYTNDPAYVSPLYAYASGLTDPDTGDFVCAIVGGTFYNPDNVQFPPDYVGTYFFSDLWGHWIKQYNPNTGVVSVFATGTPGLKVDLLVDSNGSLYYLAQDNGGELARIDYSGTGGSAFPPLGKRSVGTLAPTVAQERNPESQPGVSILGVAGLVSSPVPVSPLAADRYFADSLHETWRTASPAGYSAAPQRPDPPRSTPAPPGRRSSTRGNDLLDALPLNATPGSSPFRG